MKRHIFREEYAEAVRQRDEARQALEWVFNRWLESIPDLEWNDDIPETPDHDCGYYSRPDTGYCEFHDEFWKHYRLAFPDAFLSNFSEEDAE